ncbi:MAG TPA: polysaccharide biosynthesis/export family protein [Phycisphaerae bacterium]|nr:polysaccharide biosynthesis/export family protein [Phycisphaerae bacterium]HNU43708.1 polysaccharide biosynthesis/export family protein [Phycisphaerae bacterium]
MRLVQYGLFCGIVVAACGGCSSILNGWLDPSVVGTFDRNRMTEIRTTLTIEDMPPGLPGEMAPTQEDLQVHLREYPISSGDALGIEINQLRQRLVPFQAQAQVDEVGQVVLPVLGRVQAAGLTPRELEVELARILRERGILQAPEVMVTGLFLSNATYSIFGIGVSAATNAPLRAGTFPLRRPDLRILDAINQVGGLNEFVTDIYVFRYDEAETGWIPSVRPPAAPERGAENGGPPGEVPAGVVPETDGDEQEVPTAEPRPEPFEGAVAPEAEEVMAAADAPASPPVVGAQQVPPELEVDPSQPFIWVGQEFVPNPAYRVPRGTGEEQRQVPRSSLPPAIEAAGPAVNWARIAGENTFRVIRIPGDSLRSGDPESNIVVRGGDVIRIVSGEIGVYYMMGQVLRVGPFAFNSEAITLKAAIATAGGLTSLAWPDRCTVYRRVGQREQIIQVNLDRIFAGKDPDFYLRRGDVVNVGTHPFAPFLQRIRAWTLPTPVNNLGYSFTYARNFADIDSYSVKVNPANQEERFPNLFP